MFGEVISWLGKHCLLILREPNISPHIKISLTSLKRLCWVSKYTVLHSGMQCCAFQCNFVYFILVQCSVVQCSAVYSSMVQCGTVKGNAMYCTVVRCSAVQCSAVQCSVVLVCVVQCSVKQCSSVECIVCNSSYRITSFKGCPWSVLGHQQDKTIFSTEMRRNSWNYIN